MRAEPSLYGGESSGEIGCSSCRRSRQQRLCSIGALSGSITAAGLPLTINDPGDAENAITVGATHRDLPYSEIELDRFGNLIDPLSPDNMHRPKIFSSWQFSCTQRNLRDGAAVRGAGSLAAFRKIRAACADFRGPACLHPGMQREWLAMDGAELLGYRRRSRGRGDRLAHIHHAIDRLQTRHVTSDERPCRRRVPHRPRTRSRLRTRAITAAARSPSGSQSHR